MALDENFLIFISAALLVLFTSVVALPSPRRIERDPSTAFKGGKRALVNLSVVVALFMGGVLVAFGDTGGISTVVGTLTMVHIGGISLIAMAVLLVVASLYIQRLVRRAGRGTHEDVIEVGTLAGGPAPPPAYLEGHGAGGYPPARGPYGPPQGEGRYDRRPPPQPPRRVVPPPYADQGYERPVPPPRNGAPPPRGPPRRRPPVG